MKPSELNDWITLLANIGVLAGIIFLGIEISQNNQLMASQERFNRFTVATAPAYALVGTPELSAAVSATRIGGLDQLSPDQQFLVTNWVRQVWLGWEWTFKEIPREEIPIAAWNNFLQGETTRQFWEANKYRYEPNFVEFVDENVLDL